MGDNLMHSSQMRKLDGVTMQISSLAQRKLNAYAELSEKLTSHGTEVRGVLHMDENDIFYIRDITLIGAKSSSSGYVESGADDLTNQFKEIIANQGLDEAEAWMASIKGDWHKHPGGGHQSPSGTDDTSIKNRLVQNWDADVYPFIITDNKGNPSCYVALRYKTTNSIMTDEEVAQIFEIEHTVVFDEVDDVEYKKDADLLAAAKADLAEARKQVEGDKKKVQEKIDELVTLRDTIEKQHKTVIDEKEKEISKIQERVSTILLPNDEEMAVFEAEMKEKVPATVLSGGGESPKGEQLSRKQRKAQQRMMNGGQAPTGTLSDWKDTCPKCSYLLKFCRCDSKGGSHNGNSPKEDSVPSLNTGSKIIVLGDVVESEDDLDTASQLEQMTITELGMLSKNQCPETQYRILGAMCMNNCGFFDKKHGECALSFIVKKSLVEFELTRREIEERRPNIESY